MVDAFRGWIVPISEEPLHRRRRLLLGWGVDYYNSYRLILTCLVLSLKGLNADLYRFVSR